MFVWAVVSMAQINAVTETGDEVILYHDGTWKYAKDSLSTKIEIPVNDKQFVKDAQSTFLVKSKKLPIGIWINPKKWSFGKESENEDAEFQFQMKGEDLYAMLIAEKVSIPLESFKNIVLENAKEASPDIKIVKQEYRNVNGIKVLMLQMQGTIQGIKFIYYGYYYSNEKGTIQLLTFTGASLFKEYKNDIELFLNGLVQY